MLFTDLGSSQLRVSRLALGTATFGVAPPEQGVDRLVNTAIEAGITLFDTANSYGNQSHFDRRGLPPAELRRSAEELLGGALKNVRDHVIIASKVGEPLGPARTRSHRMACLTRQHIREQAHASLRRLGVDRIDIYYAHHPDPQTPAEQIVSAFQELISAGDIGCWAVSNHSAVQLHELMQVAEQLMAPPPVANQIRYHLAHRDIEKSLLPSVDRKQVGLIAYSPLGGGLLAGSDIARRHYAGDQRWGGRAFTDHELKIADGVGETCKRWGYPPAAVALRWLLQRVDVAVIGPSSPDRVHTAIAGLDLELSPSQLELLDKLAGEPADA